VRINQKWPLVAMSYALIIMLFFAFVNTRKDVTVFVDGKVLTGKALGGTVSSYLNREGIEIAENDRVTPNREEYLEDGIEIRVERTVPVCIISDGKTEDCWVVAENVEQAVCDAGIELGELDRLEPGPSTRIQAGMIINVIRVLRELNSIEEDVAYTTVRKEDTSMDRGNTKVVQEGQDGKLRKTYLTTYENGVAVSKELVEERMVEKPVSRIVHVGTGGTITRGGRTVRYTRVLDMVATGYWGDPAWSTGYTAIGMVAKKGIVAVDPRVIPLRTWVYVEGYGFAYAADVGRNIKGNRIDLCFDNSADAWAVGRRRVRVYVLGK
jgi:uncharacterized protein YabE (DUF348 family)/3D (Asp-Asp-Asp) domain-containing protein